MRKYAYYLLALFGWALISSVVADNIKQSDQKMAIWIDVRTAEEYSQGHVTGAIHIPYEVIGNRIGEVTQDRQGDIRVYCRSGRRSGVAQETLKSLGFTHVTNEGGYEDLVKRKAAGEAIP
jgi:phage shock protein E